MQDHCGRCGGRGLRLHPSSAPSSATDAALYLQIGDGAIMVALDRTGEDLPQAVFWPQHGEFANSTFFLTMENAAEIIQTERRTAPPAGDQDLALFTDGLERLDPGHDRPNRPRPGAHPRSSAGWLRPPPAVSANGAPSPILATYLNSANVNRRTDDDKTLIVAMRATPAEPAEP